MAKISVAFFRASSETVLPCRPILSSQCFSPPNGDGDPSTCIEKAPSSGGSYP